MVSLCLIHTPCLELRDDRLEPPLGMLYIATVVQSKGFDVEFIDLSAETRLDLYNLIPNGHAVYGFSTYSVNYELTRIIHNNIKISNPTALTVAGGPHATALPNAVSEDGFDVVVTNEGELAILTILRAMVAKKSLPKIIRGIPPDPLDKLPFPDFDLVNLDTYSREVNGQKCLSLLTSRGCPYPCSFCNSNIMGAGKPIRYRTPEHVVAEIRQLKQKYGVDHFRMQDDMFTINKQRIRELTPMLAAENIAYRCFSRVNNMSLDMATMLRESGCLHASFGVESGSPKILAKGAMSKSQTPAQIVDGLQNAAKVGIKSRIYLMVGFPGETHQTIQETIDLVSCCEWDEFAVYPVIAYPGTPLHDNPKSFGITYIDKNYSDYFQIGKNFKAGFTIRTSEFDEQQVLLWRNQVIEALIADGRTWAGDSIKFK